MFSANTEISQGSWVAPGNVRIQSRCFAQPRFCWVNVTAVPRIKSATAAFILGAGLSLAYLSSFLGPPQMTLGMVEGVRPRVSSGKGVEVQPVDPPAWSTLAPPLTLDAL